MLIFIVLCVQETETSLSLQKKNSNKTMKYKYNKYYLAKWLNENHSTKKSILDALEITDFRSLGRWLNGAYMPIDKIIKFCNYFNVNINNFFLSNDDQITNELTSQREETCTKASLPTNETNSLCVTDLEVIRTELRYKDEIIKIKEEAKQHEDYVRNELMRRFDSIREDDKRHINDLFDMCKYLREKKDSFNSNSSYIDTNVSESDIDYMMKWTEDITTSYPKRYGPRVEWDYGEVQERIKNSQFIGYRVNGNIEGYLTFKTKGRKAIIREFVVSKRFRKKGIALDLVRFCVEKLREEGYLVVTFKYISKVAKSIVVKANFSEYVMGYSDNPDETNCMLKYLTPTRAAANAKSNVLVLWEKMPDYNNPEMPNLRWAIVDSECTLPILHYAYKDWYVGIFIKGKKPYIGKVKEFYTDFEINDDAGDFIYVDEFSCKKIINLIKLNKNFD